MRKRIFPIAVLALSLAATRAEEADSEIRRLEEQVEAKASELREAEARLEAALARKGQAPRLGPLPPLPRQYPADTRAGAVAPARPSPSSQVPGVAAEAAQVPGAVAPRGAPSESTPDPLPPTWLAPGPPRRSDELERKLDRLSDEVSALRAEIARWKEETRR